MFLNSLSCCIFNDIIHIQYQIKCNKNLFFGENCLVSWILSWTLFSNTAITPRSWVGPEILNLGQPQVQPGFRVRPRSYWENILGYWPGWPRSGFSINGTTQNNSAQYPGHLAWVIFFGTLFTLRPNLGLLPRSDRGMNIQLIYAFCKHFETKNMLWRKDCVS